MIQRYGGHRDLRVSGRPACRSWLGHTSSLGDNAERKPADAVPRARFVPGRLQQRLCHGLVGDGGDDPVGPFALTSPTGPLTDGPPAREAAKARVVADRWHVGFTDISGGQGMLGQVEGRTATTSRTGSPASQPAAWRDRVRYVAVDMCTVFVSAVRRYLPHAELVVDHFHVVKLAGDAIAEVRRRVTTTTRGRRGRDSEPE
ncbi:transposase IS204/IS1001/IS1096/IS1165 family protein [Candidatus Protofrankia datiscae]|uniref:Transposase IS204/IS1001/IS1096/IS1165 family protein n=1 Tax=Candidatus Protofrankia datiscae TaxID=2716812 RepID=F8AWZ1_9ACTN|nr:transposase IS204/IS1001/IS1096/IS1165 family protein [Candidatus Protofrankia datiscae]